MEINVLNKNIVGILVIMLAFCFAACDSGDINDKQISVKSSGKTVNFTATISGAATWNSRYKISLAVFNNGEQYAFSHRDIPENTTDGTPMSIDISSIPNSAGTVELIVTNSLHQRILTLAKVDLSDYQDNATIAMNLGSINIDKNGCMQMGIFNQACIQCHGGNGGAAGNLNLTAGNPPDCLIGIDAQSSVKGQGYKRVVAGNPSASLMYQILNEGGENILRYNHTEVLSSQFKANLKDVKTFISDWINSFSS